ncbi:L,D-transpeptidase, YkuD-like Spore protein [Thermobacillus xylanilyticus]|uniref:L,D-transpeptidase, YkuD-like Spore protein n=1 Tax=Thermobacillus xylanilyticus TaxID=76633 RepID=A0ABN7RXI8_THEXY|nr:L,D-transpeptidase [Thermobacillus xylanilyticus]CAG5088378.1 L,D-transpeptidase, YkuD-like Spore protein [Thermobacillus xylanilyticus]
MEEQADIEYLKQYVRLHPDNRMAWYLLGRAYMQQGKEAKANYCFLQAGDIYEAYERKRHPLADAAPREALEQWNRGRRRRLAKRAALLAVMLIGLVAVTTGAPDGHRGAERTAADAPAAATEGSTGQPVRSDGGDGPAVRPDDRPAAEGIRPVAVRVVDPAAGSPVGEALETLLYGTRLPVRGIAVRLAQQDGWRFWNSAADGLLLAVERSDSGAGEAVVRMFDPEACVCRPADASESLGLLEAWSERREQWWVLRSAIRRYAESTGEWPASLDDLVRPYPDNWLAGDSPVLRELFAPAAEAERKASLRPSPEAGTPAEGGFAAWNAGTPDGLPEAPLEIIVDKANHRLALVSGNVILRNYEVGLGGDRTPEGVFVISEKVKNPNGREDGEFGSRGMTLSDTDYAIHGTNEPDSIGRDDSLGCIRMAKEDLEELYDMTPLGTRVTIASGVLPDEISAPAERFRLEATQDETNPGKVYRWLT